MRAFNPTYSIQRDEGSYTLLLSEFQTALTEQTTERKNLREATYRKRNPRVSGAPVGNDNPFFRVGLSSQQGGYFSNESRYNNSGNSVPTSNYNRNNYNSSITNKHSKKSNNPFRQQSQPNQQQ
jgi:hypothetical protein